MARPGWARQGIARQGNTLVNLLITLAEARSGMARLVAARLGWARQGSERQGLIDRRKHNAS